MCVSFILFDSSLLANARASANMIMPQIANVFLIQLLLDQRAHEVRISAHTRLFFFIDQFGLLQGASEEGFSEPSQAEPSYTFSDNL